ncbi:NUDIX hydrolase [Streptomyces sp. IB2014 016-6]|uniref:NUDIX hydrolase n=1 Tax=Streptomyces sp. IB2014 016-6 TaxID=2517818 RepID=UPI0011CCCC21|nr:NUDIX hydrolase [Streptomyces sp. IB2014 016-6]TXL92809.1 NUDIX hydrolase [Streptomyces sp. IB2014 016-6]
MKHPPPTYEELRRDRPEMFANVPDGIEVLLDPADIEAARRGVGSDEPVGVVYGDRFITLVRDAVRFPGGGLGLYLRVLPATGAPGVVVLPLIGAGPDGPDVVLVEHYRHATRAWHLEAPRGNGEAGSAAPENAIRELREELGVRLDELIPLGRVHADTGLLGSHAELYAARISAVGALDTAEGIRRAVVMPLRRAEELIGRGGITDGYTIAVLTRARLAGLFPQDRDRPAT